VVRGTLTRLALRREVESRAEADLGAAAEKRVDLTTLASKWVSHGLVGRCLYVA